MPLSGCQTGAAKSRCGLTIVKYNLTPASQPCASVCGNNYVNNYKINFNRNILNITLKQEYSGCDYTVITIKFNS